MSQKPRVALVTGGGRRLGRAIALALAREGFHVAVNYCHAGDRARRTCREIQALGVQAFPIRADVSKAKQVDRMVDRVLSVFGHVDLLVNNAAVFRRVPFRRLTESVWDETLDLNLKGTFLCAKRVGDHMLARGQGCIVNLASLGGIQPWVHHIPYSVSKAGVIMLTRCLAKALAPRVRVNAIAPGSIRVPGEPGAPMVPPETVPLKAHGTPKDVADLVVYLATQAHYVTGQTWVVDGGRSLLP